MPMQNSHSPSLSAGFGLGGVFARTLENKITSSFEEFSHEYWMERTIQVAMNAIGWSAPNPSVGCVIVNQNKILAEGFTQAFRKEHAERMAMLAVKNVQDLEGATAYVTLEPCSHFGSQPPCVDLFLASPISTVVIACQDPDPRVNGEGITKLKAAGKKVITGVLENEARAWHFPFIQNKLTAKPVWIAKWAQTASGMLADASGNSKWISNPSSRAYTHWLRQKYDAILIGSQTYISDEPSLTVRDCAEPHRRNPLCLIADPKGRLLSEAFKQRLNAESRPLWIYVDRAILPTAKKEGNVQWIPFAGMTDFKRAVEQTPHELPLQSIFCEGGPGLLNALMRLDVFNAVHQFIGTKEFETEAEKYRISWPPKDSKTIKWKLLNLHKFADDLLQEWVKCF